MLEEAKCKFDNNQITWPTQNLLNSQCYSQHSFTSSQSSSGCIRLNFCHSIFNDIAMDQVFVDPNLDIPLNTGGKDFDWLEYGQRCIGNANLPDNGETWICEVSESALESLFEYNEQVSLPNVNILLANQLQMVAISMIITTKDDRRIYLLNKDERGMTSHNDAAWCSQRFKEANDQPFGGIHVVCWVGDHGQLGPVGTVDLHTTPNGMAPHSEQAGFCLYRQFENVIYLNETLRQGPEQKPLLETLLRIRRGEIIQNDWVSMNACYEGDLSQLERQNFMHNKVITLCETWNEVDKENCKTLNNLGVPITVIPAINKVKHTHGIFANKQVGQIPPRALQKIRKVLQDII